MRAGKTELLYLTDSYLKTCDAMVVESGENYVIPDRTVFHPRAGGLVADKGEIQYRGARASVTSIELSEDGVVHTLEGPSAPIPVGERITCTLDWDWRYRLMRMHTALHVLSAIVHSRTGALITGNQVEPEVSRVDFSLEKMDRALIEECVSEANRRIAEGHEVVIKFVERDEALKNPGLVRLASRTPPDMPILRIVEIGEIDAQLDGGPHVKNTAEIGEICLKKIENKGRSNRRLYFTLQP
jgi:misacylated tRNA(Ala) deacylase